MQLKQDTLEQKEEKQDNKSLRNKMSSQKVKGRRLEHLVADTLTDNNIPSTRVFMSGQLASINVELDGDVRISATGEKIECKNRESISNKNWEWLEGNQYLCIKKNHKIPLVVMTLEQFCKLYKGQ